MNFADLKKSRKNNFDSLKKKLQNISGNDTASAEDNIWKPVFDENSGVGSAIIRFLPSKSQDDLPWVKLFNHYFQGPGGWYIEKSLTTLNKPDPVYEYNGTLWNSGDEALKIQARKQKRNVSYYSNIYVVKDPANPDNEGKVFLYKFGTTIFNKITEALDPKFDDEDPIDPFDMWETGANFKIRMKMKGDYLNYDDSAFDKTSALHDDDKFLEAIYNKITPLQELVDPANFKTYEQLKARFDKVMGKTQTRTRPTQDTEQIVDVDNTELVAAAAVTAVNETVSEVVDDPDDALALFEQLSQ
tara:strand:+ start:1764 stop:2666 length:903 start_codon:yes stop_codon:yes gene_type:complete